MRGGVALSKVVVWSPNLFLDGDKISPLSRLIPPLILCALLNPDLSFLHSLTDLSSCVWSPSSLSILTSTPVRVLLRECGWLSVVQLGVFHSLVTIYKIFQTKSPHYLYLKLSSDCSRVLRASSDSRIRLGRQSQAGTELAKKSFKYRATRDWNMLPLEIKQARKVETFKIMLKRWVSENISIS